MKKHPGIFLLLIAALVVFAMLPLQASAASGGSRAFAKLSAANVGKYAAPLPSAGGKAQTARQIKKELAGIGYKMPGKGSVIAANYLEFSTNAGVIDGARKVSSWTKLSGRNLYRVYEEKTELIGADTTTCVFSRVKGTNVTAYGWDKGTKTGIVVGGFIPKAPAMTNCKKYSNAKVLGEKCFVYSYVPKGGTETIYNYVSRKTGLTMKTVKVDPSGYTTTTINFVQKYASKPDRFFKKPKGVAFSEMGM